MQCRRNNLIMPVQDDPEKRPRLDLPLYDEDAENVEPDAQMRLINKWLFSNHFRHFFAFYINTFHKTEIQTVILRCWTGLNPNWFKCYDTIAKKKKKTQKGKNHQNRKKYYTNNKFFTKLKKTEREIFAFYVITFKPIKI